MQNLPNILTFARIAMIPLVVLAMLAGFNILALIIFIIASATDFLDGYLARKYKVESKLGTMLDPIADKLLVAAVLVLLARNLGEFDTLAVIIILLREVFVSGLREFLGQQNIAMPVTKLAKWKTATQLIAIATLLLQINIFSQILLWLAASITLVTGWQYAKHAFKNI